MPMLNGSPRSVDGAFAADAGGGAAGSSDLSRFWSQSPRRPGAHLSASSGRRWVPASAGEEFSNLGVDVGEFLDVEALADAGYHLLGVEIDADRVLVARRAVRHPVTAGPRGVEIVEQQFDLVVVWVVVVHRRRHAVVDAAMRADALVSQLLVMVGQHFGIEGEGDVVEADLAAGARRLAFGRRLFGKRAGVDKGDAVVLVVIADEGDELVLVEQFGAEHRAVPSYHLLAPIGLQHEMRKLLR